jgi:hypothetical protein
MSELPASVILPTTGATSKIYKRLNHCYELGRYATENTHYYAGTDMVILLYFMYLTAKYRQICYHTNDITDDNLYDLDITYEGDIATDISRLVQNIIACVEEHKKVLVFPFIIHYTNGRHANLLIYRRDHKHLHKATKQVLEHFEPHGGVALIQRDFLEVRDVLEITVNSLRDIPALANLDYVDNPTICPKMGLQNLELRAPNARKYEKGYCAAWSMLITELVLENPTMTTKEIVDKVFEVEAHLPPTVPLGVYLRLLMRGYTANAKDILNKYYKNKLGIGEITYQKLQKETTAEHAYRRMKQLIAHVSATGVSKSKLASAPEYKQLFQNITPVETDHSMSKSPQLTVSKSKRKHKTRRRRSSPSPTRDVSPVTGVSNPLSTAATQTQRRRPHRTQAPTTTTNED